MMPSIILPDGNQLDFDAPVRVGGIAAHIGPRLAKAAVAGKVNGKVVGLDYRIEGNGEPTPLRILTQKDPESLGVLRHSCAHVMARAVMRLWPDVQLAFGPTVEGGFYYDFGMEHKLSDDDFPAIEAEMARIIALDEAFERIEQPREKAIEVCRDLGQALKIEHIETGLAEDATLSFYRQGEFIDLCRGPHIPSPKLIGAFKLLSVAGA